MAPSLENDTVKFYQTKAKGEGYTMLKYCKVRKFCMDKEPHEYAYVSSDKNKDTQNNIRCLYHWF